MGLQYAADSLIGNIYYLDAGDSGQHMCDWCMGGFMGVGWILWLLIFILLIVLIIVLANRPTPPPIGESTVRTRELKEELRELREELRELKEKRRIGNKE